MRTLLCLMLTAFVITGCTRDTRPVPYTYTGHQLYADYRKQKHAGGYRLSAKETADVLARRDLKTTGEEPSHDPAYDKRPVRFIYGGKYYWAYHDDTTSHRDTPVMYGPFKLPGKK